MAAVAAPYSFLFGGLVRFCGGRLLMPMDKKERKSGRRGKTPFPQLTERAPVLFLHLLPEEGGGHLGQLDVALGRDGAAFR